MADQERDAALAIETARQTAKAEATAAEQERVSALSAAFPNDPGFVMAQASTGATVEQAKAAYCDVLTERLAASDARTAELEAAAQKATERQPAPAPLDGADPVVHGAAPTSAGDFMAAARALAEEKGITKVAAMKRIAREQPELHQAFKESARAAN